MQPRLPANAQPRGAGQTSVLGTGRGAGESWQPLSPLPPNCIPGPERCSLQREKWQEEAQWEWGSGPGATPR